MRTISLALCLTSAAAFTAPHHPKALARVAPLKVLQTPHGGTLVDLFAGVDAAAEAKSCTKEVQLNVRQLCDVELICNGGFSPLTGFMDEATYLSVVKDVKLPSGLLFSLPVVFDTNDESLVPGDKVLLKQGELAIATMVVESKYLAQKPLECKECYGTASLEHPGTLMVALERGKYYVSGPLKGLAKPVREFPCKSPQEVRAELPADKDVVAFQCRNPVHRAHYELFTRALDAENVGSGGVVMVHPTCGPTQADDIDGTVRYKTYEVLKAETQNPRIVWNYLPYSMHMAGPREAIHHMMIRKNYGCTHFIIGRDMAGSKSSLDGEDFYGAYEAQDFAQSKSAELGVKCVPSLNLVYTAEEDYVTADYAKEKGLTVQTLSGTKFRKALRAGEDIPEWFAFKSVVEVLRAPGNGIN
jgi:sulfate adenylyltransferase